MNPHYYAMPGLKYPEVVTRPYHEVMSKIMDHYKVSLKDLQDTSRKREKVVPRQLCMSVLFLCHKWTLVATGNLFNRDHTTVIHSIQAVKNLIETDSKYSEEVKYLFPEMMLALKNRKDYPLRNIRQKALA